MTLGLLAYQSIYAMPPKDRQDKRLQIILNKNNQLCVYSSDLNFYLSGYYVKPIGITTASRGIYAIETQNPQRNDLAGNGKENCVVDTQFFKLGQYNQAYRLMVNQLVPKNTGLRDSINHTYTDFCIENKNQQIRLVSVKKQGNRFVCTDKDWQPHQPKKGFWSRLFGGD